MSSREQVLVDLIHDLAQPLGNIDISVYCLDHLLDGAHPRAQEHVRLIRQQLAQATSILAAASAEVSRTRLASVEAVEPAPTFAMAAAGVSH